MKASHCFQYFYIDKVETHNFSYVQLPADQVDTQLLQDASRKEIAQNKAKS